MKKHNLILNVLFLISTIFNAVILVKDIDDSLSNKFVIGYVVFLLLYFLFLLFKVILKLSKLKRT
ncbi:hypothetical protein CN514_19675, partial [Bacillus sp. AFS001701]|uniref:hypothetical protein n=1 Tax=Bacillus sp. AFS001701 TaxID=2033480 RepID=UPI000BFAB6D2